MVKELSFQLSSMSNMMMKTNSNPVCLVYLAPKLNITIILDCDFLFKKKKKGRI